MATYNFPNAINGDTFDGVLFNISINGSPLNLTSGSIEMTVLGNGHPYIFSTQGSNITILEPPTSGSFQFNRQIVSFGGYGNFDYEMVFKLIDGSVKTYLNGTWAITKV